MWQGQVCSLKKSGIWGINSARESSSGKHDIGYLASQTILKEQEESTWSLQEHLPNHITKLVWWSVICGPCCYRSQRNFAFASPQRNIDVMCPSTSLIQPTLESKFSQKHILADRTKVQLLGVANLIFKKHLLWVEELSQRSIKIQCSKDVRPL